MKKIYVSLMLAVSMVLTLTSCNMDKEPYGSLPESEAIQGMNDITRYRAIFYTNLRTLTSGNWVIMPELQMDVFHGIIGNGNRDGEMNNGTFTSASSDISDRWSGLYACIANANFGISKTQEMAESGTYTDAEVLTLKRYNAEGHFLRAFAYFYLADHFCPAYTSENANTPALGAPLQLTYAPTGVASNYPGRSTLAETYKQIEDDLEAAYTQLVAYEATDNGQVAPEAPYLSSYAVMAMQARVALQKKDYATALTKAEAVINSGKYQLTEISDYVAMWTTDKGTELIFRPYAAKDELPGANNGDGSRFLSDDETSADYLPTSAMLYLYDDSDIRFEANFTVYNNLQVEGNTMAAYVFSKFPGNVDLRTSTTNNFRNMPKPFRLSEQYLIAAEAAAATGDATKANKYLNDLRAKRIDGYTSETLSGNALTEGIRSERLKELIGEGFRMGDLRRWGIGFERKATHDEAPYLDVYIVKTGAGLAYHADDHRFTWPIPTEELDANPQMKGQQNAGY